MKLGITGNTTKDALWKPVAKIVGEFLKADRSFALNEKVARGLVDRGLISSEECENRAARDLADSCDIVLSFGGDGTMLNTVHEIGNREIPILGVNIGRLGFLAHVETGNLADAIRCLDSGQYEVEERLVLEAKLSNSLSLVSPWALNEFALQRSGEAGLLAMDVHVDNAHLNTYWADGLIVATPTGSTAYSLALGGPILAPRCGCILITPIAPHTLSVRPIVLPESSEIRIRLLDSDKSHVFSVDGRSTVLEGDSTVITIKKAPHSVHLVKLPDQNYFSTLRGKLMWGVRKT